VVNLAAALGEQGKQVLLIDLDAQCNASRWLGLEPVRGVLDLFEGSVTNIADIVTETALRGVFGVAATPGLVNLDRALAGEPGAEQILKLALQEAEAWDIVLIDCPPALGLATLNALATATSVLIACEMTSLAVSGLDALLQTIEKVRARINPELAMLGIVPNKVDFRTRLTRDVIDGLRARFNGDLLDTCIRQSIRLAEAPSFRLPINSYDPTGRGAHDFRDLASEVAQRAGL